MGIGGDLGDCELRCQARRRGSLPWSETASFITSSETASFIARFREFRDSQRHLYPHNARRGLPSRSANVQGEGHRASTSTMLLHLYPHTCQGGRVPSQCISIRKRARRGPSCFHFHLDPQTCKERAIVLPLPSRSANVQGEGHRASTSISIRKRARRGPSCFHFHHASPPTRICAREGGIQVIAQRGGVNLVLSS
jgi:hypothetical protein